MSSVFRDEVINAVLALKKTADHAAANLITHLEDKSISLEERWSAFERLCTADLIVNIAAYGDGDFDLLWETANFETFYITKFETVNYLDVYEQILESFDEFVEQGLTQEGLDAWREKVLSTGDKGYIFDW